MKRLLILFLLLAVGCNNRQQADNDSANQVPENSVSIIYYKSTDGSIIQPNTEALLDAHIVSNTYEDGVGVICFDGPITVIDREAFYNKNNLYSIIIPNGVTEIGDWAFSLCYNLKKITLPDSVTTIGEGAFSLCYNLKKITLPDSVTKIGHRAFRYCTNLTSITIPNSLTEIGFSVFEDCTNLTSITIPNSVTSIGDDAFMSCDNLKEVYCKATTPPDVLYDIRCGTFDYNASGRKIYVPRESVEAYKSADGWWDYASAIVGYDF